MKTIYRPIFLLLLCFSLLVQTAEAGSEANFKRIRKEYTVGTDSYELRVQKEVKLHTHVAFNDLYGETFIVYNPNYQKLTINKCYTTQQDGTVIQAPANAFNEVLPAQAANAPAYNHLREMVVTHTGLEIGATIFLDYTLVSKSEQIDIDETLQEQSPIDLYEIVIHTPQDKPLHYVLNEGGKTKQANNTRQVNGMTTYTWTLRHLPAEQREPFQPHNTLSARLTANNYTTGQAPLLQLTQQLQGQGQEENNISDEVLTKIIGECKNEDEKREAALRFVVEETSLVSIPFSWTGQTLRSPQTVIESGYGTLLEKTALLFRLLQKLELKPQLTALYPAYIPQEVSGLASIEQIVVKCANQYYSVHSTQPNDFGKRSVLYNCYLIDGQQISRLTIDQQEEKEVSTQDTIRNDVKAVNGFHVYTLPKDESVAQSWAMTRQLNEKRRKPIELPERVNEKQSWEIVLSDSLKLASAPTTIELKEKFGMLRIVISPQSGNKVAVQREIQLNQLQIEPNQYKAFRNMMEVWDNSKYKTLLIAKE